MQIAKHEARRGLGRSWREGEMAKPETFPEGRGEAANGQTKL